MTLLILLAALSGAEALSGPGQVNGLLRESVTIQCRYGKDYKDSVKYWCKGHTKQLCDTVVKTDDLQTNNRISIRDNKTEGVFTVTMRELREEDEGRYWCGIEQTSFDEGTSAYLTVNKDTVTGWTEELVTIQCLYDEGFTNNVKYWSRGTIFKDSSVLVRTDGPKTSNMISISDNKTKRVFTVTMRGLREEDEGRYWCGIQRTLYDEGTSVYLTVNKGTFKPTAETPTTTIPRTTERAAPATASTAVNTSSSPGQRGPTAQREGDTSNLTIVLSVVCGCLLLLCMLCLMIRMKINRDKQKGNIMSSTQPSPTYTTVRFQNNAQMPASDDGIYANMNSSQRQTQEPQSSESVEYSVLAF
ncbi:CMRF35-like molecule 1 isoform X2 [Polyodon spathula]|uniref:CMRF35-like molecule 1 isoform X2 n=1 Tax=Polyodon spathula TaxID=7913 RepID=UPI001B7EDBED|nr:CMRF35-like molecule 1 isoform X2 [Polyodon spathula]XP_041083515.1 CMRF35-like molecule 1 isoform X2 [Polyodon spathula]